jgi:hypothetical protein
MIVDEDIRPLSESPPLPAVESTLQHCILAGWTKKSTSIICAALTTGSVVKEKLAEYRGSVSQYAKGGNLMPFRAKR